MIGARVVIAALCMAVLAGCASAHVVPVKRADAVVPCAMPVPERDVLVGVALSGGGSRAALFGAAGLEALSGLRTATARRCSSRSRSCRASPGGVWPPATTCSTSLRRTCPCSRPPAACPNAYRAFFDEYRAKLSQDFESALIWRQLGSFRWLNSSLAAQLALRDPERAPAGRRDPGGLEPAAGAPGTPRGWSSTPRSTTTGAGWPRPACRRRRSATTSSRPCSESVARQGRQAEIPPILVKRWELLRPMTPLEINMDPCPMRLAGMVTASASFPPLVGPITLQVRRRGHLLARRGRRALREQRHRVAPVRVPEPAPGEAGAADAHPGLRQLLSRSRWATDGSAVAPSRSPC